MTRTISVYLDGVRYEVEGDYCPGCGYAGARFETTRVTLPDYKCDARIDMSLATVRELQAEALAACIEGDAQVKHDEERGEEARDE